MDARLDPDRLADALLERRVERRPARHRYRKARARPDHDAARAVAEADPGKAETRNGGSGKGAPVVAARNHVDEARPELGVAVEAAELLLERHLRDERARLRGGVAAGADAGFGQIVGRRGAHSR